MSRSALVFLLLVATAAAVPRFRQLLPNPKAGPADGLRCPNLGHANCKTGKNTVNQFGADFRAADFKYTVEFCNKDSDGDGVSNGAELGDPCCAFARGGQPLRSTDLSHPGESDKMPANVTHRTCPEGAQAPNETPADPNATPDTTIAPGTTGNAGAGNPVCFPAAALVTLASGKQMQMSKLQVGDRVLVAPNTYSTVYMFTHALPDARHSFVQLATAAGAKVTLTRGHYIYASGELKRASDVKTGETLTLANGETSAVVRIGHVEQTGLYNPQTLHGDIVVDGVRASTYTEILDSGVAHALLSVLRAYNAAFGLSSGVWRHGADGVLW